MKKIITANFNDTLNQLFYDVLTSKDYELIIQTKFDDTILAVESVRPDYVFVRANLGFDIAGIDLCRQIRSKPESHTKCVVLFSQEIQLILPALFTDISGYLYENTDSDEIELCLQRLSTGERYINPAMFKAMRNPKIAKYKKFIAPLTAREKDIFRYLGYGYSNKKIADTLFTCIKTVETHKFNIVQKLELKNMADLREITTTLLVDQDLE